MQSTYHIVAGCLLDTQKRLLVIRSPNDHRLTLPGAPPEAGERPTVTLARVWERLPGAPLDEKTLAILGRFRTPQADDDASPVDADVFMIDARPDASTAPGGSDDVTWLSLDDERTPLSPLLRDAVLPALKKRFHP